MTKKSIYRVCLALPLLVPLVLLPVIWNLQSLGSYVAVALMVILYSLIVGGVPYLLLVVPLLWWSRNKTEGEVRKALLLSPVLMLIPLALCYAVFQFGFEPAKTMFDTAKMFVTFFMIFGVCTLALGYLYVGITFGLAALFGNES